MIQFMRDVQRKVTLPIVAAALAVITISTAASAWAIRSGNKGEVPIQPHAGGSLLPERATQVGSLTTSFNRQAHLWRVPTTIGGRCLFMNIDPTNAQTTAYVPRGGGWCRPPGSDAREPISVYVTWEDLGDGTFSVMAMGEVSRDSGIAKLELQTGADVAAVELRANAFIVELPRSSARGRLAPGPHVLLGRSGSGETVAQLDVNDVLTRARPEN